MRSKTCSNPKSKKNCLQSSDFPFILLITFTAEMPLNNDTIQYDIIIVGSGPAGSACALALKGKGLRVAIIDKATFPRDKVCGDAIPGRAIRVLKNINAAYGEAFRKFPAKYDTKKTTVFYKGRHVTFNWVLEAYTCTRMEFDNFLHTLVKDDTATDIYTNTQPGKITISDNVVSVPVSGTNKILEAKMIVGADGAHSTVAKQLTKNSVDRDHYVGSVRAYFSNVTTESNDTIEVYFDKRFLPSYLWVFPLPGNMTNVGFGMLSSEISKRKVNLKRTFYEFIEHNPVLSNKFKNATRVGELEGFGLPLGSRIETISGSNFLLTGDAASLIDPISGDGIGNAMLSGKLAAEQAIRCFEQDNFTDAFMKGYDNALMNALGKELRMRHKMQKTISQMPFLLDALFLASKSKVLKKTIQKAL